MKTSFSGKRRRGPEVVWNDEGLRVTRQGKCLTIRVGPATDEADVLIELDDITHWDPPDEETEISIDDLNEILAAIEAEADERGLSVAFE